LKGFDFLLDTISIQATSNTGSGAVEESKDEPSQNSLQGSDLDKWFSAVSSDSADKEKP
jgi:hypothetical protein